MIVRQELPADVEAARRVQAAAFAVEPGVEPVEVRLLDELRVCDGWVPALSLVAVIDDEVVGHAVCTVGHVAATRVVALGPIGVAPEVQRSGVGLALVHSMIGAADALGHPCMALLGSPAFYGRFGFVTSTTLGITPPEEQWGEHFQVRTLTAWDPAVTGAFVYARPFQQM